MLVWFDPIDTAIFSAPRTNLPHISPTLRSELCYPVFSLFPIPTVRNNPPSPCTPISVQTGPSSTFRWLVTYHDMHAPGKSRQCFPRFIPCPPRFHPNYQACRGDQVATTSSRQAIMATHRQSLLRGTTHGLTELHHKARTVRLGPAHLHSHTATLSPRSHHCQVADLHHCQTANSSSRPFCIASHRTHPLTALGHSYVP